MTSAVQPLPGLRAALPPLLVALLLVILAWALPMRDYWQSYFPYEDDFSLIEASALENHPVPAAWIGEGFTHYFDNDPACALNLWGFIRPVVNFTHYLESVPGGEAAGIRLMTTNLACWLGAMVLFYVIALQLGALPLAAAAGVVVWGLAPCWYRDLVHSSFRNNSLAALFILAAYAALFAAFRGGRTSLFWLAGFCCALGVATHEQALVSLPVMALVIAYQTYSESRFRAWRRGLLAMSGVLTPPLAVFLLLRLLYTAKSATYATSALHDLLSQSRKLTSLGITSPLLVVPLKAAMQAIHSALAIPGGFTSTGPDNFLDVPGFIGPVIFGLAAIAAFATARVAPRIVLVAGLMAVYTAGHNFAGLPEPRYTHLQVIWAILIPVLAYSAAWRSGFRVARLAAGMCLVAVLAVNVAGFRASILLPRDNLMRRNRADRESFRRIREALGAPSSRIVLVNDQMGTWSARAMLRLAGSAATPIEILPTVSSGGASSDFARDLTACVVETGLERQNGGVRIRLTYPAGCLTWAYGRDLACTAAGFRRTGQAENVNWTACAGSHICLPPLTHDIALAPGEDAILVVWHSRLEPASVGRIHGD